MTDKNRSVRIRFLVRTVFGIVLLVALLPLLSTSGQESDDIQGLEIAIVPSEIVLARGPGQQMPRLRISFTNTGAEPITIIRPVWGCENVGHRVRYQWSPVPQEIRTIATGSANITSADIVTISPGQCLKIKAPFYLRPADGGPIDEPGSYVLTYRFDPTDDKQRESFRDLVKRSKGPQKLLYEDDPEIQALLKKVRVGTKTSRPLEIDVR